MPGLSIRGFHVELAELVQALAQLSRELTVGFASAGGQVAQGNQACAVGWMGRPACGAQSAHATLVLRDHRSFEAGGRMPAGLKLLTYVHKQQRTMYLVS
jgi:hypothetical protein